MPFPTLPLQCHHCEQLKPPKHASTILQTVHQLEEHPGDMTGGQSILPTRAISHIPELYQKDGNCHICVFHLGAGYIKDPKMLQ